MKPLENVPLSDRSTMRLGGKARYLLEIKKGTEIAPALEWARSNSLEVMMIGIGSNIVWRDEGFDGLILVNKISGIEFQKQDFTTFVTAGAGEIWDKVVEQSVIQNLSGIEQLSIIPGTVGATPVQNVGAYGREISEVLITVQAYDTKENKMVVIPKSECDFSYRKSRFNTTDKGRFFVVSVTLSLSVDPPMPPFYMTLQGYLSKHNISKYTPQNIRQAVIDIRNSKLPDPAKVANCGSFFKNPIVGYAQLQNLIEKYPGIKYWEISSDEYKLSAAWILESLGLKGYKEPNTGMSVWSNHSLVFVNESAKNTASLLAFRDAVAKKVKEKFSVELQQEPELLP